MWNLKKRNMNSSPFKELEQLECIKRKSKKKIPTFLNYEKEDFQTKKN
jgi:hypothetical protein